MARTFKLSSKLGANSLLYSGLLALLLFAYVCLAYAVVVAVGMAPYRVPLGPLVGPPWYLNGIALLLIALTFLPVARFLRRRTYDLVYAEHDDPYQLVSRISEQIQIVTDPTHGLPLLAETIATDLRLPYVAIDISAADPPLHAAHGIQPERAALTRLPVSHVDRQLGVMEVSARGPRQDLTASDMTLLQDLARQLGVAFHAIDLSSSLQATRERLVIAREEERRRIRNDLHDGLAPTLASLQLQLGAVKALIQQNPEQAVAVVEEMREDLRDATAAVRQLVYNLRPPMLDELGLVSAIRNMRLAGPTLRLDVVAPDPMPKLPAAVEVAAFRIATEAIHNVVNHAQATQCLVLIEVDDRQLVLSVCDNGQGMPESPRPGVGLHSMRERASELGGVLTVQQDAEGGTVLTAILPIERPG